jgi:hypothetical protein
MNPPPPAGSATCPAASRDWHPLLMARLPLPHHNKPRLKGPGNSRARLADRRPCPPPFHFHSASCGWRMGFPGGTGGAGVELEAALPERTRHGVTRWSHSALSPSVTQARCEMRDARCIMHERRLQAKASQATGHPRAAPAKDILCLSKLDPTTRPKARPTCMTYSS